MPTPLLEFGHEHGLRGGALHSVEEAGDNQLVDYLDARLEGQRLVEVVFDDIRSFACYGGCP